MQSNLCNIIFINIPCSVSRRQSQRMSAGAHPGERATSKIWSFWHQCAVPAASSANPPAYPQCSSTTIPVCHLWLSWWSWMTVLMPTSVEKILLLWKISQTSQDCEEHCLLFLKQTKKKKKSNGHFISNGFTNLNVSQKRH